jgi:hypothetical protein
MKMMTRVAAAYHTKMRGRYQIFLRTPEILWKPSIPSCTGRTIATNKSMQNCNNSNSKRNCFQKSEFPPYLSISGNLS